MNCLAISAIIAFCFNLIVFECVFVELYIAKSSSSYFLDAWRVPERRKLKKSASTESLNAEIEITGSNRAGNNAKQINGPR